MPDFASRAGQKLDHALSTFQVDVSGLTCADLGSNTGGFVDCLLKRGAAKIFAVERGYGVLDYKLRINPHVIAMERTNAMHVILPEPVSLITIDVSWTKQKHILPNARKLLTPAGQVITLIKPHYEANPKLLRKGILPVEHLEEVVRAVRTDMANAGFDVLGLVQSPIQGTKGNIEFLALLALPRPSN